MCKNLFMIGITNPENAFKFAKVMAPLMSEFNGDGLGYAALTSEGKVFSEKWLENKMAFFSKLDKELVGMLGDLTSYQYTEKNYSSYGEVEMNKITTMIMHTRKSTNRVCIENTHPFTIKDNVLCHNGVINNHDKFRKEVSTCDSESILTQCIDHKVSEDIKNFDNVSLAISGWYACAYLSKQQDKWQIDVFRNGANLYACHIKEIGALVISTSDEDLRKAIIYCGFTSSKIFLLKEKIITRFNPMTGERIAQTDFKSFTYTYTYSGKDYGYGNYRGNSGGKNYGVDDYDDDYYGRNFGASRVATAEREASDSKYLPKFVCGSFTESDIDELEEIYTGLTKEAKEEIDAKTDFKDRYEALDKIRKQDKQVAK